ncbi:MAG TPA: hypothetical protein VHC20_05605 [Candidatus Paceibacterota bacterium]|nr:hypothetical protein [Candidatus Paceibacterota bacterium]
MTTLKTNRARRVAPKTVREKLEAARAEALRERFRAGGAMQDLQRAADELQVTMIELDRAVWKTGPQV